MQLSKKIPARTKTVKFRWCEKNFTEMSDSFRKIREKTKRDKMNKCFWCDHLFVNGEKIALAGLEKGPNKVLCQGCADELLSSID